MTLCFLLCLCVGYLPLGAQRSSVRLGRVEQCRIFFWLIVLWRKQNVRTLHENRLPASACASHWARNCWMSDLFSMWSQSWKHSSLAQSLSYRAVSHWTQNSCSPCVTYKAGSAWSVITRWFRVCQTSCSETHINQQRRLFLQTPNPELNAHGSVLICQACWETAVDTWSRWTFRLNLRLYTDPLKSLLHKR